jgi:hypothetical protein
VTTEKVRTTQSSGPDGSRPRRRRIALVAHDDKKEGLLEWARYNRDVLARHDLLATGSTGRMLADELNIGVTRFQSGPLGGDQQIGSRIAEGDIDLLIFVWGSADPAAARLRREGPGQDRRPMEHPDRLQPGERGLHHLFAVDERVIFRTAAAHRDDGQPRGACCGRLPGQLKVGNRHRLPRPPRLTTADCGGVRGTAGASRPVLPAAGPIRVRCGRGQASRQRTPSAEQNRHEMDLHLIE